jgi:hypothetical protein
MNSEDFVKLFIVLVLIWLLYYYFSNDDCHKPVHNDGTLVMSDDNSSGNSGKSSSMSNDYHSNDDHSNDEHSYDSSMSTISQRAQGRDNLFFKKQSGGQYKHSSYDKMKKDISGTDYQFSVNDVTKNHDDKYVPVDESGFAEEQSAPVRLENNVETEKDKFNADSFLPKDNNKDWFETIDAVEVKNADLINLYRPIGANTIGNTHKIACYDIRGLEGAICPKFTISPWLQSSVEPDRSTKSLCN